MNPQHEHGPTPQDAVRTLLTYVGEDPTRDGLVDTPDRLARALWDLTAGYRTDVAALLDCRFESDHDQLVVVRDIPFHSLCEHHVLPFKGTATVGYLPNEGIVGLSKLVRLVDAFARRLQVQERLTDQIVAAINQHLAPHAAGCVIASTHMCMTMRGIERHGQMVTSRLTGLLRTEDALRNEFLSLARTD